MKDKWKLVGVFSVAFAMLGLWTALVFSEVKGEHDILLAQARPYEWVEQYRPLSGPETDALLENVHVDELEDGDLLIVSYKGSLLDPQAVVRDTDAYKIWKSADCYELKMLAMQHSLKVSTLEFGLKKLHVVIDEGRVWSKSMDEVRSFADSEIIEAHCSDLLSMQRFRATHSSPAVY